MGYKKVGIEVQVIDGKAQKDLKNLQGGIQNVNKEVTNVNKTSKKFGTGLIGAFKGIKTAILGAVPALQTFTAALFSTGVGALVVAVGGLISIMRSALIASKDFSKALSGLEAVSGATEIEMSALTQQAKDLGSSTAFTASQVVKLQTELAKLGFSVQDIANSTPAILDLASSLEVDLASAAEFAGSVVRSFGLTTEETQRVVDVMALSTASSALNFDALSESLKIAAPTARAVGISVERTTALLGALADTGLKGSIAGTGLSKTFIELNKEGISLEDAMSKVRNSTNQLNTAVDLVGVVGAKSLLNLANAGEKIADLEETFNNAAGAARNIAETRLENLSGDLTKLSSAWEGFLLNLEDGSGLLNSLARGAVQFLTNSLTVLVDTTNALSDAWFIGTTIISERFEIFRNKLSAGFDVLGGKVKVFALNALSAIADIPILGAALDGDQIERNLVEAEQQLVDSNKRLNDALATEYNTTIRAAELSAQRDAERKIKLAAATKRQIQEELGDPTEPTEDESKEVDKEAEKAKRLEQKRQEAIAAIRKEFTQKQEDKEAITEEAKLALEKERALQKLTDLKATEEEKQEVLEYYAGLESDLENKRAKESEDLQKAATKVKIQQTIQGLNAIAQIAGKESAIGKAAAIASATISGIEGVQNAYTTAQKSPITLVNPAYPAIQAAIAGAFSAAQIASIIRTPKPNVSGNMSSGGSSVGRSAVAAPQPPAFNVVGAAPENQLAQALGEREDKPVKAFVVSNEVTNAQSLDRNIVETASVG
jgi:hypothetical protein